MHRNPSPLATVKLEGRVEFGSTPTHVKQEVNEVKVAVKKEKKKSSGTSASEDDVPLVSDFIFCLKALAQRLNIYCHSYHKTTVLRLS